MLTKLMGTGDLLAALVIVVMALSPLFLPKRIIFYIAGYLILKGGMFALMGDIASYLDVFCGIYLVLMSFGVAFSIITIGSVVFLIQKNAMTFVT